jgi:hypothetical protein
MVSKTYQRRRKAQQGSMVRPTDSGLQG